MNKKELLDIKLMVIESINNRKKELEAKKVSSEEISIELALLLKELQSRHPEIINSDFLDRTNTEATKAINKF